MKQESRLESLETIANSYKFAGATGESGPSSSAIASIASRLKSTSTLGQFPTNPLSAQERVDKREDLDVRRAMYKTAQRNGITHQDDLSDEDDVERTGDRQDGADVGSRQAKRLKKAEKNGVVLDVHQSEGDTAEVPGPPKKQSLKKPKKGKAQKVR